LLSTQKAMYTAFKYWTCV